MTGVLLEQLDEILAVLTEAVGSGVTVRAYMREPEGSTRPARIVEGLVLEVADGRDGRTRVRFAIPTGSGDPVEVRVLVEGIERTEALPAGVWRGAAQSAVSGELRRVVETRPTEPYTLSPVATPRVITTQSTSTSPDQTGRRRRPTER